MENLDNLKELDAGFNSLFGVGLFESIENITNDDRNYIKILSGKTIDKAKNRTFKNKCRRKKIFLKEIEFFPSYFDY